MARVRRAVERPAACPCPGVPRPETRRRRGSDVPGDLRAETPGTATPRGHRAPERKALDRGHTGFRRRPGHELPLHRRQSGLPGGVPEGHRDGSRRRHEHGRGPGPSTSRNRLTPSRSGAEPWRGRPNTVTREFGGPQQNASAILNEIHCNPIRDSQGNVIGASQIVRDVTHRAGVPRSSWPDARRSSRRCVTAGPHRQLGVDPRDGHRDLFGGTVSHLRPRPSPARTHIRGP